MESTHHETRVSCWSECNYFSLLTHSLIYSPPLSHTPCLFSFVGDCQMYKACEMFIDEHASDILRKNLRYNLILHLMCLYDYGLIDALQKASLVQKLTGKPNVTLD